MNFLIWPAAIGIGLILALFGAGGGLITVPALIYLAGLPVKEAIAMSLWIVAIISLLALIQQNVWRQLQVKLLLTFGITGIIGSIGGSYLATYIPEKWQLILFSGLILTVTAWLRTVKLDDQVSIFRFIPATVTGFVIGILTGVLGVGGGFLLVPALIYLGVGHFPTAVAHSLVLITLNSVAGGITYLNTTSFSIKLALTIGALAAVGSMFGVYFLKRLPAKKLQNGFNILLIILGSFMLWRTITN